MPTEFTGYLLGSATPMLFLASVLFSFSASLIMLLFRIKKRDKSSTRTPQDWSWNFFWKDTLISIVVTVGFMLLLTRILFNWKISVELAIGLSIIIGLISDRIGVLFSKAADESAKIIDEKIDEIANKIRK